MDRLDELFERQKRFQKRVNGVDLPVSAPSSEEVKLQVTAIVGELGEILEEYQGWKDWRKSPPEFNREDLLMEVVDLWHFVINLTLYLGFNEDEFFKAFVVKNNKNHVRQDNNY